MIPVSSVSRLELGQLVRRADDPSGATGYVVAVMLTPPYEALVRWDGVEASFEPLDALVDVTA